MDRRRFLGWSALGGLVAVGAAVGYEETKGKAKPGTPRRRRAGRRHVQKRPGPRPPVSPRLANGVVVPTSEPSWRRTPRTGTAWWVTSQQNDRAIEGFASQVSAVGRRQGHSLRQHDGRSSFHVEAYRMGYYQGIGGRLVWRSAEVRGVQQPDPVLSAPTNTIECQWSPSLSFTVGSSWPPGAYLLKLVGATGEQQFVPSASATTRPPPPIVIQSSVTTWQAYNRWGGYSLYYGNADGACSYIHAPGNGTYADRARIVSFDRPYDLDWANGAADFVGNELPFVYHAEQLGLDVTYWTDVDLHPNPSCSPTTRRCSASATTSTGRRPCATAPTGPGRRHQLRLPRRQRLLPADPLPVVCRRTQPPRRSATRTAAEDPLTGANDALVTVNWPQSPVDRPEAQLIGSHVPRCRGQCRRGDRRPHALGPRRDRAWRRGTPPGTRAGRVRPLRARRTGPSNVDVVAHSVVPNRGGNYSDVTWYTARTAVESSPPATRRGSTSCRTARSSPATRCRMPSPVSPRPCCGSWRTSTRSSVEGRRASRILHRGTGVPSTPARRGRTRRARTTPPDT